MKRNEKGITLVVLVVTIIILLILAGVAIAALTGENGLFARAKEAKEKTQMANAKETMNLKISEAYTEAYAEDKEITLNYLQTFLKSEKNQKEIEYAETESQKTADTEGTQVAIEKLYVRLKAYPYEFEINNKIEIAKIDGIDASTITTGGSSGTNGGSGNGNTGIQNNSDLIHDFEIEKVKVGAKSIQIAQKENIIVEDGGKVIIYIFFINNEAVGFSEECNYEFSELDIKTEYDNIYVMAIDNKGNLKKSSNVLSAETTEGKMLSNVCSVGDLVQYSADNISSWKVWNINDDGTVEIIADKCVESYNPKSSFANARNYLGNNSNWARYENKYAVAGSALGAITKEMYEKNYKINPNVCKVSENSPNHDVILLSERSASVPWVASWKAGTINTGGDDGNNLYSIRPVVTLNCPVIDASIEYNSDTGWALIN